MLFPPDDWEFGSSRSVVISAMMYGVAPAQLAYGRNLRFVLIYAVLAIVILSGMDWILR